MGGKAIGLLCKGYSPAWQPESASCLDCSWRATSCSSLFGTSRFRIASVCGPQWPSKRHPATTKSNPFNCINFSSFLLPFFFCLRKTIKNALNSWRSVQYKAVEWDSLWLLNSRPNSLFSQTHSNFLLWKCVVFQYSFIPVCNVPISEKQRYFLARHCWKIDHLAWKNVQSWK